MLIREAAEDIYLIVNRKWDYDDIKANQRLREIFEEPQELLRELGKMKAAFGDKILDHVTDAEEMLRDIENSLDDISAYISARSDYDEVATYEIVVKIPRRNCAGNIRPYMKHHCQTVRKN